MRFMYLSLFVLVIASSCKKTDDTELPTAAIDDPIDGDVVFTDDNLRIVATLSDNTGLLQYKLTIDGIDSQNVIAADSTLSMIFVDAIPNEEKAFYLDQIINLDPNTFNGQYQMVLSSLDIEGNESTKDTVNFEIVNSTDPNPPVFSVSGPTVEDTLGFGEGFILNVDVMDLQMLSYVSLEVARTDGSHIEYSFGYSEFNDNSFVQEVWLSVDSTWSQGEYHIYFTAWDNVSAVSYTIPFHVSY